MGRHTLMATAAGRGKSVRREPFELFNGIAYYAMDTRKHLNNGLSFKAVDRAEAEFTWDDAWASDLDLAWGGDIDGDGGCLGIEQAVGG